MKTLKSDEQYRFIAVLWNTGINKTLPVVINSQSKSTINLTLSVDKEGRCFIG